jgi:hypothetical protein
MNEKANGLIGMTMDRLNQKEATYIVDEKANGLIGMTMDRLHKKEAASIHGRIAYMCPFETHEI